MLRDITRGREVSSVTVVRVPIDRSVIAVMKPFFVKESALHHMAIMSHAERFSATAFCLSHSPCTIH